MRNRPNQCPSLDDAQFQHSDLKNRLGAYLTATGAVAGPLLAAEAQAVVVSNTTVQPFGINGDVSIDFNQDTQIDFQIDHDRVNLNGTDLDYLQIDKNDVNGADNPIPIDGFTVFPVPDGQGRNFDHGYIATDGDITSYPLALTENALIGPSSTGWIFQETNDLQGATVRANRLIDEDASQIDTNAGATAIPPSGTPGWIGLGGQTRYLGVRIDLQDQGFSGNGFPGINGANDVDDPLNYWYGWIGVRITNEADATGEVVGYAYESQVGTAIMAGDVGTPIGLPGDYNGDAIVDAIDYTVWRNNFGNPSESVLQNNGNGSGGVDDGDYIWWKQHYGTSGAGSGALANGGASAVPEPGSLLVAMSAGVAILGTFLYRKIWR